MTNRELAAALGLRVICPGAEREIKNVYCGDLLSWVMGRIPSDAAWITVMTNHNVAAVAVLRDAACVVLCDGAEPDAQLLARAESEGIALYASEEDVCRTAVRAVAAAGV
jgi:hypothetical protein